MIHRPDVHLLLLWLLAIPAAMPLVQPTITRSADGLLHLYRVVALGHALQQGQTLFPRWLPDLAYGYGFPLFVFYAPLSYYITLALSLFSPTIIAFNLSFVLALLLSGSGVYLFVKDIFGPKAGLLAGVAYIYAPFQLLNTLSRGGLPAAWAMALFPFVFWIFGRLMRGVRVRQLELKLSEQTNRASSCLTPILLSALILGIALLTHNTLSLLFVPLLGLYLVLELLARYLWQPNKYLQRVILQVGLAVILGVGLAAFFLIPAIMEKDFAQVERVITSPDFDFHFNFVTLKELFSLPPPADTGLLNPDFPLTLGLAQVGLGGLGLIGLLSYLLLNKVDNSAPVSTDVSHSFAHLFTIITFATIALGGIIFMMLPVSVGVWERIPLLAFVQFPHRLLAPAAFVLAILAGAIIAVLPQRLSFIMALTGIILIFVTSVPLLYPRYYDQLPDEPTLVDMMTYEHASGAIGTTSFGEYLPIWVKQVPGESPVEPMYQSGATIERLDPAYLPLGARVESGTYGFNQVELVINSPEAFQAVFHTFYFPGWAALVDGQSAPIAPVTERGLIGVSLPAGRHHLNLYFQETPLRRVANAISAVAAIIIIGGLLGSKLRSNGNMSIVNRQPSVVSRQSSVVGLDFSRSEEFILAGLAIILVAVKVVYLDQFENPFKHTFDGTTIARAEVSRQVDFGGQVNLLGYDLDDARVMSGQTFILTVYWQARQPLTTNYSALAQLVDDENYLYGGQDNLHPGTLKSTLWQPWGYVQDPHSVPIPPGTPPGDYFLVTGLYDPVTGVRLPVIDGGDSGWSDVVAIPVTVTESDHPPTIEELGISWSAPGQTSEVLKTSDVSIRLLGATPERETIPRNDFLRIALFWEATAAPTIDYQVSLRLLAPDDSVVLQETTRPSHNRYPTTLWSVGERVRDNHALWIPPDFPAGEYRVQVQLLDEAGEAVGDWVELGVMGVEE